MNSTGETEPELGMVPPQQRLHPHHVAPQPEQRLVLDRELAAPVGRPQFVGQVALAPAVLTDRRVVALVRGRDRPAWPGTWRHRPATG